MTRWDVVLITAVSLQATVLAYLPHPQWKAFVLTLPIPFTVAALAVGRPVDATNVGGLVLLLLFAHTVRVLHTNLGWPIVPAIIAGTGLYCALAIPIAASVAHAQHAFARSDAPFWITVGCTLLTASVVLKRLPPRDEPSYCTPLPLWMKLPVIVFVICLLVVLKQWLHGFMTVFPMVSIVGAYESRHSLWTLGRQIPILMLAMAPMMVCCHLVQGFIGLPLSLAVSWGVFGSVLIALKKELRLNTARLQTV